MATQRSKSAILSGQVVGQSSGEPVQVALYELDESDWRLVGITELDKYQHRWAFAITADRDYVVGAFVLLP